MTDSQPAPSLQPLPASPPPQGPRRGNPAGIAALLIAVLALLIGIGALAGTFLGLPGWLVFGLEAIGGFLAFVAVVVGIVGLILRNRRKAAAAIGLVVGIVAGILVIVTFVIGAVAAFNTGKNAYDSIASQFPSGLPTDLTIPSDLASDLPTDLPTDLSSLLPSSGAALAAGNHTVIYSVTGSGGATVAYSSSLDSGNPASPGQENLPFEKTVNLTSTGDSSLTTFNVEAVGTSGSGAIECKITVDGTVVSDKTSSGSLRLALCIATFGG